jgi:hypothetical protein
MSRRWGILLGLAILAIAGWAYSVNYKTITSLDRLSELRAAIAKERETMQVLRVEWASLNAPERLQALVVSHNESLKLVPVRPANMKHVAIVPFPDDDPREAERPVSEVPIPSVRPADWRPE